MVVWFEPLGENKKASILKGRDYTRKNKQKRALTPLPVKDKKKKSKKKSTQTNENPVKQNKQEKQLGSVLDY